MTFKLFFQLFDLLTYQPTDLPTYRLTDFLKKTTFESYDFNGNLLSLQRCFTDAYNQEIDWSGTVALQLVPFTTTYQYDALNRPTQITQPNSVVETLSYNEGGLLESVASSGGVGISNIDYNARGQRTQIEYNNGAITTRVYDSNTFRLKQLKTIRVSASETEQANATDTLQNIHYIYDAVGNITAQKNYAEQVHYFRNSEIEPVSLYTYDALYRLTEATGRELTALQLPTYTDFVNSLAVPNTASNAMQNYTQQFLYDDLGNIAQMKSVGDWIRNYYYDIATNHLQGHTSGVTEYSYDAHGNTTSMPHLSSMLWDYKDELTEVDLGGGGTAFYNYDSSGNRTRKVLEKTGGIVETRYYLGDYELYKRTVSGAIDYQRQTTTLSDGEKVFARIEQKDSKPPVVRYQFDNHLGSASLELDSVAAIISYEEYHPFGSTSYRSGKTETEVSLKRYKYCGKERDDETGLYYYGARYYAAWLGRFVSVDPLAHQTPSWNPYHYCHNNPVNLVDPSGMCAEGPDGDDPDKNNETKSQTEFIENGINLIGQTIGIVILVDKNSGSSIITDNEIDILSYDNDNNINILLNTTTYEISEEGDILSIESKSVEWSFFQNEEGTVFTNTLDDGKTMFGKLVREYSLHGENAREFVNANSSVKNNYPVMIVKEWANLTKNRIDVLQSGKAPFKVSTIETISDMLNGNTVTNEEVNEIFNGIKEIIDKWKGYGCLPSINNKYTHKISNNEMPNAAKKINMTNNIIIPWEAK